MFFLWHILPLNRIFCCFLGNSLAAGMAEWAQIGGNIPSPARNLEFCGKANAESWDGFELRRGQGEPGYP